MMHCVSAHVMGSYFWPADCKALKHLAHATASWEAQGHVLHNTGVACAENGLYVTAGHVGHKAVFQISFQLNNPMH